MSRHAIPAEALAHHIAVLGKTGSGKSNAVKVIVEEGLDAGERTCVIDPTGAWWGLRLKADGKPSKYPVVIFGGLHADVQIGRDHGEAVAEVVATSSTPAVIDTRLMTVSERTAFFTAFAQSLLRKNRGPLRLVVDEAHLFAPQGRVADPRSGEMLHAANNLVSLGRSIGLRVVLISQRPAKLHKDSLTQVESLVAMRLIAPQDRRAIEDWIGEWADKDQGKEVVASLPSLPTGDAWIWSPEAGVLKRAHFPLSRTYDSGKAPSGTEGAPALQAIDLEAVNQLLEKTAADIRANDPRQLKAEVARLQRELAAKNYATEPAWPDQRGLVARLENELAHVRELFARVADRLRRITAITEEENVIGSRAKAGAETTATGRTAEAEPVSRPAGGRTSAPPGGAAPPSGGQLTGPQLNVLKSLAWWRAMGKDAPLRNQVAVICGWSTNSSNIRDRCSELTRMGLIDRPEPGRLRLTDEGIAYAPSPDLGVSLIGSLRLILTNPQQQVLDALLSLGGERTRDELADHIGWSRNSSNIRDRLSDLARLDIIERPRPGMIALQGWVQ